MENDHKAGSLRRGHNLYFPVDYERELYDSAHPVPWPDVNLGGDWMLNSRRVPVPREGRERCDEIRCCQFIPPPDMREDPTFGVGQLQLGHDPRYAERGT
jgi:hypothetical protein